MIKCLFWDKLDKGKKSGLNYYYCNFTYYIHIYHNH